MDDVHKTGFSFATKELARSLQQPTYLDMKKTKHVLRYLQGTKDYKYTIHPTTIPGNKDAPTLDVYVDADWAGCTTTRKSTTGFTIKYIGSTIHFGSRTQAIVALSSAESEPYSIGTGAQEALHIETILTSKLQIQIHTGSTSGKSIATRIGSSKKAKHIDLKYLFIQQLVHNGILSVHKIGTLDNIADIFTKYVTAETLNRHLYNAGLLSPDNNEHFLSRQFHKLASKQFHIHISKRDACTIHTSVVDAMVSQSFMDTILTLSF